MNSTTPSEPLLSVRGLNLVYKLDHYKIRSVRDLFVDFAKNPARHLWAERDSLHLLRDIDLEVRPGDRLAIIGVNGSGKTSLCRCIAGILRPASGKLVVRGVCKAIFDTYVGIIPELTGRENARLLARLLYPDEPRATLLELVEEAMAFSELDGFLDVPFENYSQGMKARLCLSVITARSCDLLILDEVYDSTDQFFQKKMSKRLHDFIADAGAAIFVSHSPDYVREICNRAVVLNESRIAYDGEVEKALRAYEFLRQ